LGRAAKEGTKLKVRGRGLNPEAGFLSSLPMMHHTVKNRAPGEWQVSLM
jgi:hypothetical protein